MNHGVLGTRERLQERITALEPKLRRRLRGKFRALGRGVYDLDDVLTSARRRIDAAVVAGGFHTQTDAQLAAYIVAVAERVAFEALQRERRQHACWRRAAAHRAHEETPCSNDVTIEIGPIMENLDHRDRALLELRARGLSHSNIAHAFGTDLEGQRSRWRRLKARLGAIRRWFLALVPLMLAPASP